MERRVPPTKASSSSNLGTPRPAAPAASRSMANLGQTTKLGPGKSPLRKQQKRVVDEAALRGEKAMPGSNLTDNEIIARLDPRYYDEKFDSVSFVLETSFKEPIFNADEYFMREITEKDRALDIITSRLSKRVLSNYTNFVQGMNQIRQLGDDIKQTVILCKSGRKNINSAKTTLIEGSYKILVSNRRVKIYRKILDYLEDIKRIQGIGVELKETIEKGDYVKAAKILLDCNNTVQKLQPLKCFAGLNKSLQDSYIMVHAKLDMLLLDSVRNFQVKNYENLLDAYVLLGKLYQVKEMLQKYFVESIVTNTRNVIMSHVLMSEKNASRPELFQKMGIEKLASAVQQENLLSCLLHIFEGLCDLLFTNYRMIQWHRDSKLPGVDEIYIALNKFKPYLWEEMQRLVSRILTSANIAPLKIEKVLKVLHSVNEFIAIGDEFCGVSSENILRSATKQVSISYFNNTHKHKMEDLRTMLENEVWQSIPVHDGYNIYDTKELKYFITRASSANSNGSASSSKSTEHQYIKQFETTGNPYKEKAHKYESQDHDDEDLASFLGESVESPNIVQQSSSSSPVLTSVSINLLRFIGEYLNTMLILQPIVSEVFVGLSHLFEYYVYTVYNFFGINLTQAGGNSADSTTTLNPRLKGALLKIVDHLFKPNNTSEEQRTFVIQPAKLSFMIDLSNPATNSGILERSNAIESLMFLVEAIRAARPPLENILLSPNDKRALANFYSITVDIADDLRNHIYSNISFQLLNLDALPMAIASVKWNIQDIGLEHNQYVDLLTRDMTGFAAKMTNIQSQFSLPSQTVKQLWHCTIVRVMEQLVEGFSRARQCTAQARALMSLDLQMFQSNLAKLTDLRPIPHVSHVDGYIKAFYLGEKEMHAWIKQHTEYAPRQLSGLVLAKSSTGELSSQAQKNLLKAVEELSQSRRLHAEMQSITQ